MVGGVPPQSIQENSLKKENASVARKGLMHFCFVSYRLSRIANQINRELLFIILQTVFTTTTAQWGNFT